jgi:hypothetical protein
MKGETTMTNSNVSQITDKQTAPTCRFSIQATLDGYPIEIQGEGKAGDLKVIVERLRAIGAMPPQAVQPEPTKSNGAPLCPAHNTPMKASQKPGTYFCSKKNDDGSYCRHKA